MPILFRRTVGSWTATLEARLMHNSASALMRPTSAWMALLSLVAVMGCQRPWGVLFHRHDCAPSGQAASQESPDNANFSLRDYPRFHPVPTQPVFTPRGHFAPSGLGKELAKQKATEPEGSPTELKTLPPQPMAAVPLPPEPTEIDNPVLPAVPSRLNPTSSDQSGWVFRPGIPEAALKKMDPSVELKQDPGAKTQSAKAK